MVLIKKNAGSFPWDVGPITNKSALYTIRTLRSLHILNASLNQTYRKIVYTSTQHLPNYHLINPDANFLFKGNLFIRSQIPRKFHFAPIQSRTNCLLQIFAHGTTVSVNYVNIGSDNGMSPGRRQKYSIKISILQSCATQVGILQENKARNTKMYRGQETHPIRVNARYEMNWANSFLKKFRKPHFFGQIFGHQTAENEARNTKMYRGQETHPIRVKCQEWSELGQ